MFYSISPTLLVIHSGISPESLFLSPVPRTSLFLVDNIPHRRPRSATSVFTSRVPPSAPTWPRPFTCSPSHWRVLPVNANGSPAPGRLLGSGSRKSRLPCSRRRRRRRRRCRRCCCGRFAELRGSESRLCPLPAAAMKWMFKEDHSLGKRWAASWAAGGGVGRSSVVPLPHSGRPEPPWAGSGGADCEL
jgi:hypothetical protein